MEWVPLGNIESIIYDLGMTFFLLWYGGTALTDQFSQLVVIPPFLVCRSIFLKPFHFWIVTKSLIGAPSHHHR